MDNGKILWADVGTGKSRVAMEYYVRREASRPLYIVTTAKKRDSLDWDTEAARYGLTRHPGASVGHSIVVDSWNNISRYEDVKDAFFVFDEQRLVGSGQWSKSFLKIARSNRWILLTATPGDTWLDYIPVFVANGHYRNRTEFKREHVIYNSYSKFPKVDRYVGVGKLVRLRNELLVHMPYEKNTVRHCKDVYCDYDKAMMERVVKDRWHVFEERPLRDVAELFLVMRKVANSSFGRLETLSTLIAEHPRLVVFYNFDYELEMLRSLVSSISTENPETTIGRFKCQNEQTPIPADTQLSKKLETTQSSSSASPVTQLSITGSSGTLSGNTTLATMSGFEWSEWNGHKHQKIPKSERWVYLVQYVAGSEGWNCVETDAMVFYSQTYSYKNFYQAHGRIDRLNTRFKDLYYYHLMSNSPIDRAIAKSLGEKRSFNEKRFGSAFGLVGAKLD